MREATSVCRRGGWADACANDPRARRSAWCLYPPEVARGHAILRRGIVAEQGRASRPTGWTRRWPRSRRRPGRPAWARSGRVSPSTISASATPRRRTATTALKLCAGAGGGVSSIIFRRRGSRSHSRRERLTVVTLKDQASYAAFLGVKPGDAVGGHYELDTNRLVIFDFRPAGGPPAGVNLEADQHLHSDPRGDAPAHVQHRPARPPGRRPPGGERGTGDVRRALAQRRPLGPRHDQPPAARSHLRPGDANQAQEWIPLAKLLTDDALFENAATEQLAYAEAWVFVHYALKTTAMLPKFRAYLDAIRPRRDRHAAARGRHRQAWRPRPPRPRAPQACQAALIAQSRPRAGSILGRVLPLGLRLRVLLLHGRALEERGVDLGVPGLGAGERERVALPLLFGFEPGDQLLDLAGRGRLGGQVTGLGGVVLQVEELRAVDLRVADQLPVPWRIER